MIQTSLEGIKHIKSWELLRLEAYTATENERARGIWTIGWGHTRGVTEGMKIVKAQAEKFLREDLAECERDVYNAVEVHLTQHQIDCLVSFRFNVGGTKFRSSTLVKELNKGNYDEVPNQLRRWTKQRRKDGTYEVLPGLKNRRDSEVRLWNQTASNFGSAVSAEPGGGPTLMQTVRASKTAKGGLGLAGVGLMEVNSTVSAAKLLQNELKSIDLVLGVALVLGGILFVINRWIDSKNGRAI